jgi:hypothetical protein
VAGHRMLAGWAWGCALTHQGCNSKAGHVGAGKEGGVVGCHTTCERCQPQQVACVTDRHRLFMANNGLNSFALNSRVYV